MTRQGSPVSFRDADIEHELLARGDNRNEIAQRDLDRYYRAIERELSLLEFSLDEWGALAAATISTAFDERVTAFELGDAIFDAIEHERLAERFPIEPGALLHKLSVLRPAQVMAVVDRLEIRRLRRAQDN